MTEGDSQAIVSAERKAPTTAQLCITTMVKYRAPAPLSGDAIATQRNFPVKKIIAFSFTALLYVPIAPTSAAPVTINGATFDAPGVCQSADRALVCKVDGQQLELWVTRKPLAPEDLPARLPIPLGPLCQT